MTGLRIRFAMTGLVLLHLLVVSLHGIAHKRMAIELGPWERVFVGSIILAAPLVALSFFWTSRHELGATLLAVFMASASAFGIAYHFFLPTSDNVFCLRHSGSAHWFTITAVLLAFMETVCWVWCVWMLSFARLKVANGNR